MSDRGRGSSRGGGPPYRGGGPPNRGGGGPPRQDFDQQGGQQNPGFRGGRGGYQGSGRGAGGPPRGGPPSGMGGYSGPRPEIGPTNPVTKGLMDYVNVTIDKASQFPRKPQRKEKAPGRPVPLYSNMFRMAIKQSKAVHMLTTNVDIVLEVDGQEKTVTKKLGPVIRRQAVTAAVTDWVNQNKPQEYNKNLKYNYCLDNKASAIFCLFDMFKGVKDKSIDVATDIELDTVIEGKVGTKRQKFFVKFFRVQTFDLTKLAAFSTKDPKTAVDVAEMTSILRFLNTVLRAQIITVPNCVATESSMFIFNRDNLQDLSPTTQMVSGTFTSARVTENGLMFNIGNSVGAFYKPTNLIDFVKNRLGHNFDINRPLRPDQIDILKKDLFNKQVEATHINYGKPNKPHYKKYRVKEFVGPANKEKFMWVDKEKKQSKEVTIAQYFSEFYKIQLKCPNLPCINDNGRKIPIELCNLVDLQKVIRKLEPAEVQNMIRYSAVPPDRYFDGVRNSVQNVLIPNTQPLQDFGIEFVPTPIKVIGREIEPISLVSVGNRSVIPSNGEYRQNGVFVRGAVIKKWVLLFLSDFNNDQIKKDGMTFAEKYQKSASDKGMRVQPLSPSDIIVENVLQSESDLKRNLAKYFQQFNERNYDHAIVVLSNRTPDYIYRYLQYLEASTMIGKSPSKPCTRVSHIKFPNFRAKIIEDRFGGDMFISNLLLKYNTKLGGINYVLEKRPLHHYLDDGYIFISIDVCHPAPGDKLSQSIAAVVGMWDVTNPNMSSCTRMRAQKKSNSNSSTIEDVGDVGIMVREVMKSYQQKKKALPSKLVILRDGVSEGQLSHVVEKELVRVRNELKVIYPGGKLPKIFCIVVQKRHKIRFKREYPFVDRKNNNDFNIQPGTVVDDTITHPSDFTFYLAPHKAIKGTSRAPHSHVVCDEIGFSQDLAQAMIHSLSYLSPRCNKGTSIPTPINLADLAAERGKNIVIGFCDSLPGKNMNDDERLKKINEFLSKIGDANYCNTLFYV